MTGAPVVLHILKIPDQYFPIKTKFNYKEKTL